MLERPIAVDLFCGAGGLSLGFEQAGFRVAAGIDYDPIHSRTHQSNFPDSITITGDVSKLEGIEICEKAGIDQADVDVLIGGPPCQGFSIFEKIKKSITNRFREGI